MREGVNINAAFLALPGRGQYRRLAVSGLYHLLARYAKKAGVQHFHPHLWRHTSAVRMLEKGVPIKEIQYRLGHESIATTEKYLGAASITQEESSHCDWIAKLKKPDLRYRRWR